MELRGGCNLSKTETTPRSRDLRDPPSRSWEPGHQHSLSCRKPVSSHRGRLSGLGSTRQGRWPLVDTYCMPGEASESELGTVQVPKRVSAHRAGRS